MDHKKKRYKPVWSLSDAIIIILLLIPFLLLIFPAYDFATQTHTVFPAGDIRPEIRAQDDKVFKGDSQIDSFSYTTSELKLNYRLRPGAQFPSVFIIFSLGTGEKPLDLSGIKSVSIVIGETTVNNILLFFQTLVPGVSHPELENAMTWRPNQCSLELAPGVQSYTVEIEKFVTELWWLAAINVDPHILPQEDYKRVINFTIMLNPYGSSYVINKPEQIVVKRITFTKSMSGLNLAILIGVILVYTGFYFLRFIQIIRSYLSKIPERKPVQVVTYYEQDIARIKEFLESHYCNPDISVNQIYQELGIPRARMSKLLDKEYHLTFRQIINKMRVTEAKRLLKQTDLRILDVAYTLGFKNITYFNYLFKEHTGLTPSEFKEQKG